MTPWSELTPAQRATLLRPLIEVEGLSYAQAAIQLGTTRNSAVGVGGRHGFKSLNPANGGRQKKTRTGSTALKVRQSRASHKNRPVPGYPEGEPADPTPLQSDIWLPLPGVEPVALEHHRDNQCRWPCGQHLYCGAPVRAGEHQVYCDTHHRISVKVLPPRIERKSTHNGL